MKSATATRQMAGGAAFGAARAVATGSTPIGVAIVAGVGAAAAWRKSAGRVGSRREAS